MIATIFTFCAVSMAATMIIYDRIFVRYDEPAPISAELEGLVQQRQLCTFYSGENLLTGYYYGAAEPAEAHGLIVLVPGFSAGGDDYLSVIGQMLRFGWGVFTFDTTGTLRSEGKGQVGFSQSIPDLQAALVYVENHQRFGYNELVLMGHSRGAYAVCCALAQTQDVAAVVSISGVNSAMEAIMQLSTNAIGPVSYGNYGFLWLYQAALFGTDTLELEAAEVISQGTVPVLVVHGTQDETFPVDSGSIISYREQIQSSYVEYVLYDGGHTDILYDADGAANCELMEDIHSFLIRSLEK